jgi:DNA-directed RNA polymerase subunit RPC12/RpoP
MQPWSHTVKRRYVCSSCGKQTELDTEQEKRFLLVIEPPDKQREVYMVKCPHCGAHNRVEIAN